MTFAIIGYGTVGKATRAAAEFHGHECVGVIDPLLDPELHPAEFQCLNVGEPPAIAIANRAARLADADLAFVCVSTPSAEDGSLDTSAVCAAFADLEARSYQGAVVVRSTVPPTLMEDLALNVQPTDRRRFLANPEFLRIRDIEHTSRWPYYVVIGGNPAPSGRVNIEQDPWVRKLVEFYRPYFDDKVAPPIFVTDYRTAAFYKLLSNALIAANIMLADEAWEAAQALNVDWQTCYSIAQRCPVTPKTIRVDPDDRGFGGACLPKDLCAFVELLHSTGGKSRMFEEALVRNESVRYRQEARHADD